MSLELKWIKRHAYLYERIFTGALATKGLGRFKERYLGRVDDRVAKAWEERGHRALPPPLKGATLPPKLRPEPVPVTQKLMGALNRPGDADPRSRLATALWFADAAHAADVERIRRHNQGVDEHNRRWYEELVGPRVPAKRAARAAASIPSRDSAPLPEK